MEGRVTSARTWNVGLVGLNIGRSHIVEGYVPNPALPGGDALRPRRGAAGDGRRRVRHRGPHARPSTTCSPIPAIDIIDICTPPLLHRPHGRGGARGRQARRLREAADRLARRLRRDHRRREGREGRADADLPVPLRRRRREGEAHHRRRHRRQALRRQRRDLLEAHARVLRRALARQMGDRARRRARHPRAAPARHGAAPRRARPRGCSAGWRRGSTTSRSRTAPAPAC